MNEQFCFFNENISVIHTNAKHPPADNASLHAHSTYEIYVFVSGKGRYRVENTRYPLKPGCVILLRPQELHAVEIDPECVYERIVIRFKSDVLNGIDEKLSLLKAFHCRKAGQQNCYTPTHVTVEFVSLLKAGFSMYRDPENYYMYIRGFLVWMLSIINHDFLQPRPAKTAALAKDELPDIIKQIDHNICGVIDIDEICREHYISRVYLNRCFRKQMNASVGEYITGCRLDLAKKSIESGKTAASAAVDCGFNDYSSFYKSFKRRFGKPPSAFSKKHGKEKIALDDKREVI